jgi:hypothetical protein
MNMKTSDSSGSPLPDAFDSRIGKQREEQVDLVHRKSGMCFPCRMKIPFDANM